MIGLESAEIVAAFEQAQLYSINERRILYPPLLKYLPQTMILCYDKG